MSSCYCNYLSIPSIAHSTAPHKQEVRGSKRSTRNTHTPFVLAHESRAIRLFVRFSTLPSSSGISHIPPTTPTHMYGVVTPCIRSNKWRHNCMRPYRKALALRLVLLQLKPERAVPLFRTPTFVSPTSPHIGGSRSSKIFLVRLP